MLPVCIRAHAEEVPGEAVLGFNCLAVIVVVIVVTVVVVWNEQSGVVVVEGIEGVS